MNWLYFCCLVALLPAIASGQIRYDGYRVYRIVPKTREQVQVVQKLPDFGVKYWQGREGINQVSDIMVSPEQALLVQGLRESGIEVQQYISNVQSLIDGQRVSKAKPDGRLSFDEYSTYEQITEWLQDQARVHSHIASLISIGQSYEGREMYVMKISKTNFSKPIVFLEANAHAREWIASAVATFTINELLNGPRTDISKYLDDFDVHVLPFLNPDGFVYTHTTDRLWRKTRSNTTTPGCNGADPNRNFDFHWLGGGSSTNPCKGTYAGPKAFSEPETLALARYLLEIKDKLAFYYGIHSYGHWLLIPHGHTAERIPEYDKYMRIGQNVAEAMKSRYGTVVTPGNVVDLLYVASAQGFDWVKGVINPYISMEIELYDQGHYGFILPADQIVPSSLEFIDGLAVFLEELKVGISGPNATISSPLPNYKL